MVREQSGQPREREQDAAGSFPAGDHAAEMLGETQRINVFYQRPAAQCLLPLHTGATTNPRRLASAAPAVNSNMNDNNLNVTATDCGLTAQTEIPAPAPTEPARNLLVGNWNVPLVVTKNGFVNKSLSMWACNIAMGCLHGCGFCYVPETWKNPVYDKLRENGVEDADSQWGDYAFLRPWDENAFLASVRAAENTPVRKLNRDGNRAVMFCTTTDPYQVFKGPNAAELNERRSQMVRRAYEIIRDHSTINLRILTRSPLVRRDFELLRTLGDRVLLGMSIPTLNNGLAGIYEQYAPAPTQRLATLRAAHDAGLHVFVAVAPTYPECDEADMRATLTAIREVAPVTVFMEAINIRAENVDRIAALAREKGREVNVGVFRTKEAWFEYSMQQLFLVQRLANELGLGNRLHLWPDAGLKAHGRFLEMRRAEFLRTHGDLALTLAQRKVRNTLDAAAYQGHVDWLQAWWDRISEWPGTQNPAPWTPPALPAHSPLTPPALAELNVQP